jgi:hypothetical protein
MVGDQAFAQGFDHRNAPAYTGFVKQIGMVLLGGFENLFTTLREQGFIGRDHGFTITQRLDHELFGDGGSADQLDDDINICSIQNV